MFSYRFLVFQTFLELFSIPGITFVHLSSLAAVCSLPYFVILGAFGWQTHPADSQRCVRGSCSLFQATRLNRSGGRSTTKRSLLSADLYMSVICQNLENVKKDKYQGRLLMSNTNPNKIVSYCRIAFASLPNLWQVQIHLDSFNYLKLSKLQHASSTCVSAIVRLCSFHICITVVRNKTIWWDRWCCNLQRLCKSARGGGVQECWYCHNSRYELQDYMMLHLQMHLFSWLSSNHSATLDNKGVYKAAAGDISPDLSSGLCDGSNSDPNFQYDMSKWYLRSYPVVNLRLTCIQYIRWRGHSNLCPPVLQQC